MSDNPNFVATFSSDEVYFGQDLLKCLTDEVNGKASVSHTHSGEYAAINHNHSGVYASINHTHDNYATVSDLSDLDDIISGKANASHNHNDIYYTKTEVDSAISTKANASHNHDTAYYTKSQVDSKISENLSSAQTYANGLNTNMDSRVDAIEDKFDTVASGAEINQNAFSNIIIGDTTIAADSKTDSLTINAGNGISISGDATNDKVTITNSGVRSISTGSSNGTISVNTNGTSTNIAVKGLGSAAYTDSTAYDSAGTAQTKANAALASAQSYADGIKNDLLNGAGAAYDTLKELGDLISDNTDAIDALETIAASKANSSDLTSHTSNTSNPHNVTLSQLGLTATASEINKMDGVTATTAELNIMDGVTATTAEINYLDGVTSNIQSQLNSKSATSHTHNYAGSSSSGGAATSANKLNTNAGSNTQPVYFANGVPVNTSYTLEKSVPSNAVFTDTTYSNATTSASGLMSASDKTKLNGIATGANKTTVDSSLSSTSTNPVQNKVIKSALDDKISKDLQIIGDNGGCILSYVRTDNKNILTEIYNMDVGFYTIYSQSGVTGNPKSAEAWRMMVHKTNATICWVQAYGSNGSVYTNYCDGDNGWRGWKCLWDDDPEPLWSGAYYMHSPNSTPQTVIPSKTLSQCQHGWLLLWSDYDSDTSTANDTDFVTTMIPKRNPSGGTWGGDAFYCDIPRYIGSNVEDVDTERRIIKSIYIHDNCIKGSFNNNKDERNDVVLRAVYEW